MIYRYFYTRRQFCLSAAINNNGNTHKKEKRRHTTPIKVEATEASNQAAIYYACRVRSESNLLKYPMEAGQWWTWVNGESETVNIPRRDSKRFRKENE